MRRAKIKAARTEAARIEAQIEAVRIEAAEVEAQVADISIAALPGEVSTQTNLTTSDLKDDLE